MTNSIESVEEAYQRGRRGGLATAALALSVIAYVNLLGLEKSILAFVLAVLALMGMQKGKLPRSRAAIALVLATVHACTLVVVVLVYWDQLTALARNVIQLYHSLS